MSTKRKLMYIERKEEGLAGPARIGWVTFSKSGRSIYYAGRRYASAKGSGFKSNYYDVETGAAYWISGCKKDGGDALYSTTIEIDQDARDEYWRTVRGQPENVGIASLPRGGKYSR